MPTVIPVKFKYATRDLWFNPVETGAQEADHVICSTERGLEIGLVTADARDVAQEDMRSLIGDAQLKNVVRIATDDDLDLAEELAERGEESFEVFRRLAKESGLDMKPVGVEYVFGGGRVVCYFSAEERVDFRQLVRDLSRELHERIDMRQIGVREEAAIVGGFSHCGQELCCARFGHMFEPVSIRMAKEQDLPLNSNKISGACGRLMCCLRYEFEAYRDFKGRAPKKNAVIETPLGKAKIQEYDTPREEIVLRLENGKRARVPLKNMECSKAAHEKSEQLNCPCRPDTVPRWALDEIDSVEIKMALADLDRENGVLPDSSFNSDDIFVEPARKKRRRSKGSSNASDGQQQSKGESAPKEGAPKKRRRRKSKSGDKPANAGQNANAEQPGNTRRRRHHSSSKSGQEQGGNGQGGNGQGDSPRVTRKHTRRPGDKGVGMRPTRKKSDAPKQGEGDAPKTATDGAPKKRRRRRGGRGRGKGNNGGSNANGANNGGSAPKGE